MRAEGGSPSLRREGVGDYEDFSAIGSHQRASLVREREPVPGEGHETVRAFVVRHRAASFEDFQAGTRVDVAEGLRVLERRDHRVRTPDD